MNLPATRIKIYNLGDPLPRSPIYDDSFVPSGSNVGPSSLPLEVAVVSSFSAPRQSGVPQARRRGRLYIGPLSVDVVDISSPLFLPVVKPVFLTLLAGVTKTLSESNDPTAQWVVWSRKGNSFAPIEEGYVNNEFDTQRRRGYDALARTQWTNVSNLP